MSLTRQDVAEAYRVVLGRDPENEVAYTAHLSHPNKTSLLQSLITSAEGLARNQIIDGSVHEHHIYRGYAAEDLDVFKHFIPYRGCSNPGFVTSFLGTKYRVGFAPGLCSLDGKIEEYPQPVGSHQGETAEFIGTLRSVLDASDGRFRMLECGAGYGTWMAICWAAARQKGVQDIHVYGIEADEGHFAYLEKHMADNDITPFSAFYGGIGTKAGVAEWEIAEDPAAGYGGRPLQRSSAVPTKQIKIFDLADILDLEPYWDLMHVDIQGGEAGLCRDRISAITSKVRRIVIGTHSRAIDGELMSVFFSAGWALENEKPTIYAWTQDAPDLESMARVDGVQVWRNRQLLA